MNKRILRTAFSPTVTTLVLLGAGLFALTIIAARVYITSDVQPWVGQWFVGPDSYMRVVRVLEWWQGGSWYESVSARSNWPLGETLHWTRPLDVLLLLLASPLWPAVGLPKALFFAGVVFSPLMAALSMAVLVWGVRGFLDLRGQAMLVVLFAFQPITRGYYLAARPDHHALILLAFCTVLALLLRFAQAPEQHRRAPAWAGLAVAFGLWVSIETLTSELVVLAALGLAWLFTGQERWLLGLRRFAMAAALALAVMMAIERPPQDWLWAEEYDRLSTVQVVLLALIALGIEFMWRTRQRAKRAWGLRTALAGAGAVGAAGVMAALFPDFFKGPFGAAMDPRLAPFWLGKIQELQPLMAADWETAVGAAQVLAPVVWVAVWVGLRRQENKSWDQTVVVVMVSVALYLPLSMFQLRWGSYLGITVSIAWAAVFQRLLDWHGGPVIGRAPGIPILRVPAVLGLVSAHFLLSGAIYAMAPAPSLSANNEAPRACAWRKLAPFLNSAQFGDGVPQVILSHIHQGPEILYRTPHRVIGTPYHRNTDGILDSYTALTTRDENQARQIMARRQVDYVILCTDSREEKDILKVEGDTIVRKLVSQTPPPWLVKVPLADDLAADFRIFKFVDSPNNGRPQNR